MRISDWSSDVCSSDLLPLPRRRHDIDSSVDIDELIKLGTQTIMGALWLLTGLLLLICVAILLGASAIQLSEEISQGLALRNTESQPLEPHQLSKLDQSLIRSEERRVGKEGVST